MGPTKLFPGLLRRGSAGGPPGGGGGRGREVGGGVDTGSNSIRMADDGLISHAVKMRPPEVSGKAQG